MSAYPATRGEFDAMFSSEAACLDYLVSVRWPAGVQCSRCRGSDVWQTRRRLWQCKKCGHQQSLTEGTLLHRTRYPLKTWLEVAWHLCEQKNGLSALGLQRAMGFGSYHTAWEWLHRARRAMVLPGRSKLSGEIEVDETFIGGVRPGKRGRGASGKTLVLVAAEIRGVAIGRIRLKVITDATSATLLDSVVEIAERGSELVTDGLPSYASLPTRGFHHTVSRHTPDVGKNLLPHVHRVRHHRRRSDARTAPPDRLCPAPRDTPGWSVVDDIRAFPMGGTVPRGRAPRGAQGRRLRHSLGQEQGHRHR